MAKPEVIIVHETTLQSWMRDASTFALFVALISIGILLDSTALQWVGAIVGFVAITARGTVGKRLSLEAARERLDDLEGRL